MHTVENTARTAASDGDAPLTAVDGQTVSLFAKSWGCHEQDALPLLGNLCDDRQAQTAGLFHIRLKKLGIATHLCIVAATHNHTRTVNDIRLTTRQPDIFHCGHHLVNTVCIRCKSCADKSQKQVKEHHFSHNICKNTK